MYNIIESFNKIKSNIKDLKPTKLVNIVAVSKTFTMDHIKPLVDLGHDHFGENKVQEAISKWKKLRLKIKMSNFIWLVNYKVIKQNLQLKSLIIYIP